MKPFRISSSHFIPLSFLTTIILGTLLLMIPAATTPGEHTDILTALFTATTSVCVTGLVVVDTYAHWSVFGQAVILLLVQIGGLGVVAVGTMIMLLGRRKFSFSDIRLLGDSLNVEKNKSIIDFLTRIFRCVFVVEGTGAVLYAVKFVPLLGPVKGIWAAVFQSVSAFCNAGMDVVGPNSMMDFQDSPFLMCLTMCLIILGGLGFVVWFDVMDKISDGIRRKFPLATIIARLSEHTKMVLVVTCILIVSGSLLTFVFEQGNPGTMGSMSLPEKILNSVFQSVTFRTAGFASVPQQNLTEATCVVGYVLMFIGGSPVGTAGGVKTVSAFLVFMNILSYVKNKHETVVFGKRVSLEAMRKAAAVVFVSLGAVVIMTLLLICCEAISLTDALYEVVSALATVGLSRGLTPGLDIFGRIVIIISMYLGRIGPISMAFFFIRGSSSVNRIRHAEGTFYVG